MSSSTRAPSFSAGELVAQDQRRPPAGHSRRLWERLWERRRELGANTYRVLVHPTPPEGFSGSIPTPRERGPQCAGGHGRLAESGACRSS